MKKLLFLSLFAAFGLMSCSDNDPVAPPVATGIELSPQTLTLTVGNTAQLSATIIPENSIETEITWSVLDPAVATVENGFVTAVAPGETTITATVGNVSANCAVTVNKVDVESITLSETSASITVGTTLQLTAVVAPDNATNKEITWSSTDEAVATVDQNGLVTGIAEGEATITVVADGIYGLCIITVVAPANIGDFYYSDGTYSASLDSSKTVIGVIFYTGDPTATDPTLKQDHPNCTHGLVMALTETKNVLWQKANRNYNNTVSAWVEANNLNFQTLISGIEYTDPMNQINGYNNTKAIEAFNAAPENSDWPVTAMAALEEHRRTVAAPATSSGWYFPSIKELNLAFSGDYQGPITDYDNDDPVVLDTINPKFRQVPDAIIYDDDYLSSTELDSYNVYDMMVFSWWCPAEGVSKGAGLTFRAVLAF